MLREVEFFHGVLFARLIREVGSPLEISELPSSGQSAYLIQSQLPLYIKYSTNRLTPWNFTFTVDHLAEMNTLLTRYGEFVLCLVCHEDGIVGLTALEVVRLVGPLTTPYRTASISVQRRRRELYGVRGSVGELDRKVSESTVIRLVLEALSRPERANEKP